MIQDSFFSFRYMILQSKENCLFFSLIVISNKVSNLWLICWMCVPVSCTEQPTFFPLLLSDSPAPGVSRKTACLLLPLNLFIYLFVFSFLDFSLFGEEQRKIFPELLHTKETQVRINFFLSPEPHWGCKGLVWKIFPSIWLYR